MLKRSIAALALSLFTACGGAEPPSMEDPRPPIAADQGAKDPVAPPETFKFVKVEFISTYSLWGDRTPIDGDLFASAPDLNSCLYVANSATLVHLGVLLPGAKSLYPSIAWSMVKASPADCSFDTIKCVEQPGVQPIVWFDNAQNPVTWDGISQIPIPAGAKRVMLGLRLRGDTQIVFSPPVAHAIY